MALIDTLKYVKFDELNDQQRAQLKKRIQDQKRELQKVMRALDQSLRKLAKKPKAKRRAKGKTARPR
jgi:Spy/CpxP family protein refolding chaperone